MSHDATNDAKRKENEANLLNESLCLAAALGVNNFIIILTMHLVILCCAA
jgi:hypothetical protein